MNRGPGEVDALLREREGYVRSGRLDRARQVDAELAQFGVHVEAAVEPPPENAQVKRGPGRPRKTITPEGTSVNEMRARIQELEET
jgi:hypothetical protein